VDQGARVARGEKLKGKADAMLERAARVRMVVFMLGEVYEQSRGYADVGVVGSCGW
jgi:hypothetical protein